MNRMYWKQNRGDKDYCTDYTEPYEMNLKDRQPDMRVRKVGQHLVVWYSDRFIKKGGYCAY